MAEHAPNHAGPECPGPKPPIGSQVQTACGGTITYSAETPCASWRGKPVYFCLPCCRDDFLADPRNSCLGNQIASGG